MPLPSPHPSHRRVPGCGPAAAPRRAAGAWAGLGLLACLTTGCVGGLIYEHTTRPLDVDFDATPSRLGAPPTPGPRDSWRTLVLPLPTTPEPRFDWGDASIAGAIEDAGFERVYYADLERLSVLRIWTQRWVHVYGE